MKTSSKVVGIVIGVLASCLIILAISLSVFVNSDHFRNILLNKINASIAGNLTVDGHEISFLKGRIALQNLTLENPPGNRPATLKYLMADIAFLPLLTRTLVIESMILEKPDIRLKVDKHGAVDIVEAFKAPPQTTKEPTQKQPSTPFDLIAQNIWITDGDCHITIEPDNLQVDLNRITIQAKADLFKKTGRIELKIENTALTDGTHHLEINPVTLSVLLPESQPASVAFKAKTDFAEIALNGEVDQDFHNPNLNLSLAFDFSLSELQNFMPLPTEFSGKTNGVLTVQGNWRDPDADLRLNYSGGSLAGYPVDGLHADLRLKNRQLLVQQLDILAGTGEISLAGNVDLQDLLPKGLVSSQVHPHKVRYAIDAGLKHIDVAFLNKGTHGVKGFLNSTATFKGEGIDFKKLSVSATMDTVLEKFFLEGMQHPIDLKMHASGKMEAGVIDSDQVTIVAAGTRLNAHGVFDLPSGHIQGQLTADAEDIQNSLSLLGMTGYSGACAMKADVSGSWKQPGIGIEITGRKLQLNGLRLGDIDLTGNLDQNGLFKIISLKLLNQGTHAQGNGTIQLFKERFLLHETMPLKARLKVSNAQVNDFLDDETVSGSFEGEIQIDGNVPSLRASTVLSGKDVTYGKILRGDLETSLRFFNGTLLLDQFRLKNQNVSYFLNGGIQFFEPNSWHRLADPVLNLNLKGDAVSLADYIPDIKGNLYLDAHLEGPTSHLQGKGYIKGEHLDLMGQSMEEMTLDIELEDNRLHVRSLRAVIETESVVTGSGWIGFDGGFSFDLHSTGMQLTSIGKIKEMEKVEGKMDFHVRGEGNVKDPSIFGDIHLKEVHVNSEKMDDSNFHIDLVHNQLSIKGRQTYELNLVYHLLNKDFSINLLFADTNITSLFLAMGKKDFGGRLSGEMVAKGNMASLEKSEAFLDISKLSLAYRGVSFAKANSIQGNLKHQHLSIPEFHLDFLKSGQLRVKGSGTLDGYFDLTADGNIPAEAAVLLLKDVTDIEGDISLHAKMKGSIAKPDFSAEIVFHDVGYALPQIDPTFKGINGKIQLTSSHLGIENITGNLDSGVFQINGNVALENFHPGSIQLQLKTSNMPIHVPETMDILFDTDLSASGTLEHLLIEGEIVMLEGVYYKSVMASLLQKVKEEKRAGNLPATKTEHSFLDRITTDIKLKYREPFIVDNDMGQMEIYPDLALSGTLSAPVIVGVAKIQSGTVTFQNRTFVVKRGTISFLNPYKIEPEINITCSVEIRQWDITLVLSGTPDRLVVELSSTPPEAGADIMSLIVSGKTTDEMGSGGTSDTDSPEALMAQVIATSFGGDIEKSTGLDYLAVETTTDEMERDSETTRLTVGKDLTDRMAIKYAIGTGKSGYSQRAITEYKLIEYFLLSGFQDIEGNYGGEIIFRIEFRIF
jgi:autotransporter translocation and assembly factor TamB